ncbi:acyl-CoA thioesterase [Arthrobacter sulfonylureivorans]|uniref:acyl-CoA thioesterase n=1 Tax=Arthrobacter sulfonylureivorans TaxID=2486855 RepID=UPI0039E54BC7
MPTVPPNAPRFPIQLRFSDVDSYGHVNNVTYLEYLETARVLLHQLRPELPAAAGGQSGATLRELGGTDNRTLVGRQEIEYRVPLDLRTEPVHVRVWVTRIGNSSFDLGYAVVDEDRTGTVHALGASTMVLAAAATGRPVPLPDGYRAALQLWAGPPVPFRNSSQAAGAGQEVAE